MKVLGLDPGSQFTGFGVIETSGEQVRRVASGVIATPAKISFAHKLEFIDVQLRALFIKHQPDYTVVEKVFLGKNVDSAFKLGHVRGVCLLHSARAQSELVEIAARKAKKLVTGHGAASKDQVQLVVRNLLNVSGFQTLDESDALALALAFWRQNLADQVVAKLEGLRI
ncbi:MAG: crossover junction endodeoxyribonuclease RuvC [Pseudomonadota bacterium]